MSDPKIDWDDPANGYLQLQPGMRVQKYTGEAQYEGIIVARYLTTRRKLRFVIDVEPQGFQMIATGQTLREVAQDASHHS
jgi:hypothetical protein